MNEQCELCGSKTLCKKCGGGLARYIRELFRQIRGMKPIANCGKDFEQHRGNARAGLDTRRGNK